MKSMKKWLGRLSGSRKGSMEDGSRKGSMEEGADQEPAIAAHPEMEISAPTDFKRLLLHTGIGAPTPLMSLQRRFALTPR